MTVIMIFIILLPILAILAIISRKHFSKYKGELWFVPQIAGRLQKMEVLYGRSLEDATRQYVEQGFRHILILLAVLWFVALGIFMMPATDPAEGEIQRPEAGKSAEKITLQLTDGTDTEAYILNVEPRELTEEEFAAAADRAVSQVREKMAGKNADLQHVTGDLSLPERDPSGLLKISWDTDRLTVISRSGAVHREDLEEETVVTVKGTFSDGIHEAFLEESVTVLPYSATETAIEKAIRELGRLEENSRKEGKLLLPEQIDNVNVSEKKTTIKNTICKLYIFLVLFACILAVRKFSREKEILKKRDEELEKVFYRFSRRLTLLISAGENIHSALLQAAAVEERYLLPEVQYAMNRIGTGTAEAGVYVQLGRSLGLKSYIRLFSTISTAGPRGSSQLMRLLDQEVRDAETEAREEAKKKGEKAQEKLLIPMVLLMIVVIGIVIYPAVAGM